jgi:hypothetical protein
MRLAIFTLAFTISLLFACNSNDNSASGTDKITEIRKLEGQELVSRGQYLTTVGGCNDCHSPKIFNAHGFTFDSAKLFSGHPAGAPLPPIAEAALKPGNWILMGPDITSFVGPWGLSFAANLTPDSATGIGAWSEENFIQALRKGKHLGMDNGRPIMPPMPWELIGKMTDEDLKAVFAFFKSLPPVNNLVPAPTPPTALNVVKSTAPVANK